MTTFSIPAVSLQHHHLNLELLVTDTTIASGTIAVAKNVHFDDARALATLRKGKSNRTRTEFTRVRFRNSGGAQVTKTREADHHTNRGWMYRWCHTESFGDSRER